MKYLRTFENIEDFKVGDTVYCIDNNDGQLTINIGESYIIRKISGNGNDIELWVKPPLTQKDGYYPKRFTKDPYHPVLIELLAKKYNL